jgi:hypothetical protein
VRGKAAGYFGLLQPEPSPRFGPAVVDQFADVLGARLPARRPAQLRHLVDHVRVVVHVAEHCYDLVGWLAGDLELRPRVVARPNVDIAVLDADYLPR